MDPHRLDPDIPDPVENRRSSSGRAVRMVYLLGLLGFAAFLAWHFLRFMVFLEGSGTITAKQSLISAPFTVHVDSIEVIAGSRVKRGEVIALVTSFEVEQYRSELLRSIADLTAREAELQIRLSIARASLAPAAKRLEIAQETTAQFQEYARGAQSSQYRIDIFRELSNAMEFHAHAEAEATEVARQLLRLEDSRQKLESRLAKADQDYNGGKIVSPIDGVVAFNIAMEGSTVLVGQAIGSVYDNTQIYIDWEMPLRRLVEPQVGDAVFITSGYSVIEGSISNIFPISTNLGADRRDFFSSTPQGQTARVKNHGFDTLLPIDSQVTVRMNYTIAMNRLFQLFRPAFRE
jgi:multidrug resistance efflux pump